MQTAIYAYKDTELHFTNPPDGLKLQKLGGTTVPVEKTVKVDSGVYRIAAAVTPDDNIDVDVHVDPGVGDPYPPDPKPELMKKLAPTEEQARAKLRQFFPPSEKQVAKSA